MGLNRPARPPEGESFVIPWEDGGALIAHLILRRGASDLHRRRTLSTASEY